MKVGFIGLGIMGKPMSGFFQRQYCIKRKRIGIGGTIRLLERLNILFQENRSLMNE